MDISQRLANLTSEVTATFHPSFIFLVHPNKIQHFPARNWTEAQFLEALDARLGQNYTFLVWKDRLVAVSENKELLAILPKYSTITALKSK